MNVKIIKIINNVPGEKFICRARYLYKVIYVKENHSKGYFYSDELEGWTNIPEKDIKLGSSIEVIPVSHSTGEYQIV